MGASASLIPFLANDEGNRALMGSNMQCQAVPLVNPESPVVGTGMEGAVANGMKRLTRALNAGVVTYADSDKIEVTLDTPIEKNAFLEDIEIVDNGKKQVYYLTKFKRTASSTCYNQRPVVSPGDKVKTGDLLADGPSIQLGELALGRNLTVAYTAFEGYGFEDAILKPFQPMELFSKIRQYQKSVDLVIDKFPIE